MNIDQGDAPMSMPDMTKMLRGTKASATLVSAIGIGATFNVDITWPVTLPNTDYSVVASVEGTAGLAGVLVAVPLAASKTTTGCTVAVKNTGLVSIGLSAVVTALAVYV